MVARCWAGRMACQRAARRGRSVCRTTAGARRRPGTATPPAPAARRRARSSRSPAASPIRSATSRRDMPASSTTPTDAGFLTLLAPARRSGSEAPENLPGRTSPWEVPTAAAAGLIGGRGSRRRPRRPAWRRPTSTAAPTTSAPDGASDLDDVRRRRHGQEAVRPVGGGPGDGDLGLVAGQQAHPGAGRGRAPGVEPRRPRDVGRVGGEPHLEAGPRRDRHARRVRHGQRRDRHRRREPPGRAGRVGPVAAQTSRVAASQRGMSVARGGRTTGGQRCFAGAGVEHALEAELVRGQLTAGPGGDDLDGVGVEVAERQAPPRRRRGRGERQRRHRPVTRRADRGRQGVAADPGRAGAPELGPERRRRVEEHRRRRGR